MGCSEAVMVVSKACAIPGVEAAPQQQGGAGKNRRPEEPGLSVILLCFSCAVSMGET